ncbi:MAG: Rossmann-like and DUF2520 domain-containing protein [Micrococcales bacterium]
MTEMQGRLSVGIIGGGPVGVVLGKALAGAGHHLIGISAVSRENLDRIESMLPEVELQDVQAIVEKADLVLLAIPASELEPTVNGFAEAGLWRPGQILLHTSGEHGINVLSSATRRGVIPIAIHPAMRFTGTSIDLSRLNEAFFAYDAPKVALPIAQALVIEMGGEPLHISEEKRKTYYEAFEVASNFSAMIVSQAIGLLEEIGVENARGILAPILRSSVEQALAEGHQPIEPKDLLDD